MEGLNAGYAALLLEQYLENPNAVPEEWRAVFESSPEQFIASQPGLARLLEKLGPQENGGNGHLTVADQPPPPATAPVSDDLAPATAAAMQLVTAFRMHGHLAARLDPLGSVPPGDPMLEPERLGLTPEQMGRVPARLLGLFVEGATLADAYPRLRDTYTGAL